jgi:glycosyltransferase involved in cell wall biosynthesis
MTRILETIYSVSNVEGGPGTVALELHAALSDLGNDCTLLTVGHVVRNKADQVGTVSEQPGRQFGYYGFSGRYCRQLLSASRDADYLVIHGVYSFTTIASLLCAILRSKPYLLIPHGSLKREAERHPVLKHIADVVFVKILMRNASAVFFASEKERRECRVPITARSVEVAPFGVAVIDSLDNTRSDQILHVAYLGRVARVKRLDVLVRAIAQVKAERPISCQIIGPVDGVVEHKLKTLAVRLGASESIAFMGTVPRVEVSEALAESDVLVLSSESENFGLAAVEALAVGLAIIVTEQVGMLEFVHGSPVVRSFPVGDSLALGGELLRIDVSGDARSERRRSARKLAASVFSWDAYARKILIAMGSRE